MEDNFLEVWSRKNRSRACLVNLVILVFSILLSCLIIEITWFLIFVESDGFGFTLSSRHWFQRYWKPINAQGYRDIEHPPEVFMKQTLFIVGDSFVAGHGIEEIKDRFSDIIRNNLVNEWTVVNIARCGWDTTHEYEALASYPHRPTVVVLSYFVNDIGDVAKKSKRLTPYKIPQHSENILMRLINKSHFLNYFYWRFHRIFFTREEDFWVFIKAAYNDTVIWDLHKIELNNIVEFCERGKIKLIVVIFPSLIDVRGTFAITSRVEQFLRSKNVHAINLSHGLWGKNPMDLIVNPMDAHPNKALNHEVASIVLRNLN